MAAARFYAARNEDRLHPVPLQQIPMLNVYRGWWVLAGLFLVYAVSNGILMHTLPLLYPALIDEFGWGQVQVTLPATVLFIVGALSSPPAGALMDRFSVRRLVMIGATGIVAGLVAFSNVTELWQMVVVYVVFAFALSLSGLVSNMLLVTRWFSRLRGRATGILLMASSLGGALFPLLLGRSMESYGWRSALVTFAIIAAVLTFIPLIFVIRDRPQAVGLVIDGEHAPTDSDSKKTATLVGTKLSDAVKQPRFYMIAFATAAVWFTVIALLQHQSIYLATDLGVDRGMLPAIFSTFFAFSVLGKFGFGWLSDRMDKRMAMNVSVAVLVGGIVLLKLVTETDAFMLYTYAAIAGIGFSGAFTTIQLLIASFYAGQSYGKILALMTMFDTLAGALGTRVIGEIREAAGSYHPAFNLAIAACVASIVCTLLLRQPDQPAATASEQKEATV